MAVAEVRAAASPQGAGPVSDGWAAQDVEPELHGCTQGHSSPLTAACAGDAWQQGEMVPGSLPQPGLHPQPPADSRPGALALLPSQANANSAGRTAWGGLSVRPRSPEFH